MIAMIVACSENNTIGRDGGLPWHLPDDLKHFMRSTLGCPVIMGRKTYESLNAPLPRRTNIVISRTLTQPDPDVLVVASIEDAIHAAEQIIENTDTTIWIAGGGEIYRAALPLVNHIVRTLVHTTIEGDASFPPISAPEWVLERSEHHPRDDRHPLPFSIEWWTRSEGDALD